MRKALLKVLGSQISLYILAMVMRSNNRCVKFTSTLRTIGGITYWEICCNGECTEFEVSKDLAKSIMKRLSTRLHQVHGIYINFKQIDTDVRYRLSFHTRISW